MSSEAEASQRLSAASIGEAFLLNVNLVFASNVGLYGLSFVVSVAIARMLGPDGRGAWSLYQSAVLLAYALLSLGVATAVIYFVSRSDMTPRRALESGLIVTLATAAVCAVAVGVVAPVAGERLTDAGVPYWLVVVSVPLAVQFRLVEGVLRAQERFVAMSAVELVAPAANLAALFAVEALFGLTIWRAIIVWSVVGAVPVLAGYAYVGPNAWPRRLPLDRELWSTLRFGLQSQAGNLVQLMSYRLDSYLVLLFVSASGVGLYAVAVSFSEGLWFVANSIATVLLPRLSASGDEYASEMAAVVARSTMLVTALGALVVALLAPFVVPLVFGDDFEASVRPLYWLLPGTVALAAAKILSAYVFSRGRPLINSGISIVTLALATAGDLILIPPFGVSGAAAAASVGYTANLALTAIAYRRLSGRPLHEALVPSPGDVALLTGGLRAMATQLRGPSKHQGPAGGGA